MSVSLLGHSPAIQHIRRLMDRVADSSATVLIQGETGTGKGVVARAIHARSRRAALPLVHFHCGGCPETLLEAELFGHVKGAFTSATQDRMGRFEAADNSTLFLDEIGEMAPTSQVRLLRVLDDKCVERLGSNKPRQLDVRIVCATNRDLTAMVADGRFRSDLYYRLKVVELVVPPLRERVEDIPLFAAEFLRSCEQCYGRAIKGITPRALEQLLGYPWPGNVRELKHVLEASCLCCRSAVLDVGDLSMMNAQSWPQCGERRRGERRRQSLEVTPPAPFDANTINHEAWPEDPSILVHLLQQNRWHLGKTAKLLGVHRTTLWRRIQRFGLVS